MKLGRVVATVVSTINAPVFDGRRLLVCDLVDPAGDPAGGYLIAVDTVGAGAGETVLLLDEGNSARQILGLATAPVRTLVVGIVDAVDTGLPNGSAAPVGPAEPEREATGRRRSRADGPQRAAARRSPRSSRRRKDAG